MKEAPRFDDGEPIRQPKRPNYCDKGSHFMRSIFHRALVKAEQLGIDESALELPQNVPIPYPIEGITQKKK